MARIRNIKPAFFKDSDLYDAEKATGLPLRVAYAGLWTVADRAGRFKWKPREIKTDVLPYDDVDMEDVLTGLENAKKIFRYKSGGFDYGFVLNFEKHQFINRNEIASQIPEPPTNILAQNKIVSSDEYTGGLDTDTDTDGLTQTKDSAAAPPPKPVRKSNSAIPDNFPTAEDMRDACAYWAKRDRADLVETAQDEAQRFIAHHTAHGKRMADWGQAWVTWYSNAIKFNRKPNGNDQRSASERRFSNLKAGASGAAFVDGERGQGVEAQPSNLVRLALSGGSGK